MKYLEKGDLVLIVAPAGAVTREDIQPAIDFIESNGWIYEFGANLFGEYNFGYRFSGTEEERLSDMQWAFDYTEAKAIWFARGGYGCVHLVDRLDYAEFFKNPKLIIGYSDNTVFHQHLNNLEIETVHGVVCSPLKGGQSEETYLSLDQVLKGESNSIITTESKFNELGEMAGELVGGNLSILYSLLGSKSMVKCKGKILLIEDWYESYYHIDRMLMALERAGVLEGIKGFLIGAFTRMEAEDDNAYYNEPFDEGCYEIIANRLKEYNLPKVFNFPSGHIYDNRSLLLGSEYAVSVNKKGATISSSRK